MNGRLRVAVLASALVVIAGAYGASQVAAAGFRGDGNMVSELASRFGLNESEVETFFEEQKAQMHEQREADITSRLDELVSNGTLTDEQKNLIIAHHEEVQAKQEELKDLEPEARREAMQGFHEEMETWASDNGINMQDLGLGMKMNGRGGRGMH